MFASFYIFPSLKSLCSTNHACNYGAYGGQSLQRVGTGLRMHNPTASHGLIPMALHFVYLFYWKYSLFIGTQGFVQCRWLRVILLIVAISF